ncbi:hypothetical protein HAX54_050067, partial [Datura stramonium]|nr:hypothetical protein [Datura stramonium]
LCPISSKDVWEILLNPVKAKLPLFIEVPIMRPIEKSFLYSKDDIKSESIFSSLTVKFSSSIVTFLRLTKGFFKLRVRPRLYFFLCGSFFFPFTYIYWVTLPPNARARGCGLRIGVRGPRLARELGTTIEEKTDMIRDGFRITCNLFVARDSHHGFKNRLLS